MCPLAYQAACSGTGQCVAGKARSSRASRWSPGPAMADAGSGCACPHDGPGRSGTCCGPLVSRRSQADGYHHPHYQRETSRTHRAPPTGATAGQPGTASSRRSTVRKTEVQNIPFELAEASGISWMTSQCSTTLSASKRKNLPTPALACLELASGGSALLPSCPEL
jgi:hypothetical protein